MPLSEQDGFEHGQQWIGGTTTMVSKVTGSFDDSGIARSAANQSPGPTSIVGSGRCVWRSWLVPVCWKKVLMENPLNVLMGI